MKGQETRRRIVAGAAPVFNVRGFAGTSIADILDATKLEKGGLYRHFAGKDDLALAAFDHAVDLLRERHQRAVEGARSPLDGLLAWIDVVADSVCTPAVRGGCPILNTATEADDTHPALRSRAAAAMREWQRGVSALASRAIEARQLRSDLDPSAFAAVLVASLEGALMTTQLLRDRRQMVAVRDHLRGWIQSLRLVQKAS